jgi:hypothetical protein
MPTNLPDPRKRKAEASEEPFVYMMIAVIVVGILTACAIVASMAGATDNRSPLSSFFQPDTGEPSGTSGTATYTPTTLPHVPQRKVGDKVTNQQGVTCVWNGTSWDVQVGAH